MKATILGITVMLAASAMLGATGAAGTPGSAVVTGTTATTSTGAAAGGGKATGGRRDRDVEFALERYPELKDAAQRAAVADYLGGLDHTGVAEALVGRIEGAKTGIEATAYNHLLPVAAPEGCAVLLERLKAEQDATLKGKLIVASRQCATPGIEPALTGCLADERPVGFEAKGSHPRRVCDLAYDELYLKLRKDPKYGLDPTPQMRAFITEHTPLKTRAELIAALRGRL